MGSVRGVDSLLTFSEISESEVEVERLLDINIKSNPVIIEQVGVGNDLAGRRNNGSGSKSVLSTG